MPDRDLMRGINTVKETDVSESKRRFKLVRCGNCVKQEKGFNDFKACQRCSKVAHCGNGCQKEARGCHQKVCGKKSC